VDREGDSGDGEEGGDERAGVLAFVVGEEGGRQRWDS
jgi:hypothetical protein